MSEPLIHSKFTLPMAAGKMVNRPQAESLIKTLTHHNKAGIVVSPAGYGKSTFLSQCADIIEHRGVACAWLSLDERDNDPARFTAYFLKLLQDLNAKVRKVDIEFIAAENKASLDSTITALINIMESLPQQHFIFIDDYHLINNPSIHYLLGHLIAYSPVQSKFVMASRSDPDLSLESLRMEGKVSRVSVRELSFSLAEAEFFLNDCKKLNLGDALIKIIHQKTEGWAAGLQLAALALKEQEDYGNFINDFSGTDRDVTDYLGEVILNQQPAHIKKFLLYSSVLEKMNASLVAKILDDNDTQALLEAAESRNLFVIPLDRNRNWYRYHHLFSEFLKTQFCKLCPGKDQEVYRLACDWSLQHGHLEDAIHYSLAMENYDRASSLIAEIALPLVRDSGKYWTFLQWVNQLPEQYLEKWPQIKLGLAWSLIFTRRLDEAESRLRELVDSFALASTTLSTQDQATLSRGIEMSLCLLANASDNTEESRRLTADWLEKHLKEEPRDLISVNILLAHATLSTFEFELGTRACKRAHLLSRQQDTNYLLAWESAVSGMLAVQQGNLYEAIECYQQGLAFNNQTLTTNSYMGSLLSILLAESYYDLNEVNQAAALIKDRFEYINNECIVEVGYAGYKVMAKLQLLDGDENSALKIIRLGQESAHCANLPRLETLLHAFEIRLLLKQQKTNQALEAARTKGFVGQVAPIFKTDSRQVTQEIKQRIEVEWSIGNGQFERAIAILNPLISAAEATGRRKKLMEYLTLKAKALLLSDNQSAATDCLKMALQIGATGGFYRHFIDADAVIKTALKNAAMSLDGTQATATRLFIRKLTDTLSEDEKIKFDRPPKAPIEPTTKREEQILQLISAGSTNREIADKLFISEQTVKWHLHQLYGKLGVRNRTSAIAKARELSLIERGKDL